MGGAKEDCIEGRVSVSFDASRSGQGFVVDDHVGDGTHQPVCDRRGLCVVLSEGPQPMDE
jgi:hypothetical protein